MDSRHGPQRCAIFVDGSEIPVSSKQIKQSSGVDIFYYLTLRDIYTIYFFSEMNTSAAFPDSRVSISYFLRLHSWFKHFPKTRTFMFCPIPILGWQVRYCFDSINSDMQPTWHFYRQENVGEMVDCIHPDILSICAKHTVGCSSYLSGGGKEHQEQISDLAEACKSIYNELVALKLERYIDSIENGKKYIPRLCLMRPLESLNVLIPGILNIVIDYIL